MGKVQKAAHWLVDVHGKTKLIRNEKRKLRAVFINNIAVGQLLGWLLAINAVHSAWVAVPFIVFAFMSAWLGSGLTI
jgi:F0F1-type ATP synthase assembly protein I